MKIFFDTEFIEDGVTIDLVSIGLVREDGREYYAQSCQTFDPERASPWVKENVLSQLKRCQPGIPLCIEMMNHGSDGKCSPSCAWRSKQQLQAELIEFAGEAPEFWADFASYDWVALAQIYGTMMQLPKGWPYWCRDVQQLRGERVLPPRAHAHKPEHFALNDARDCTRRFEYLHLLERSVAA